MDTQETLQPPKKIFNPVLISKKIEEVLGSTHDYLDDSEGVNYDAIFTQDQEPFFNNIWNRSRSAGLGYIVFHDFLIKVSEGSVFSATDMTPEGQKLFQKAVSDGLIEQVPDSTGFHRATRWKVVSDPRLNLEKIRSGLSET